MIKAFINSEIMEIQFILEAIQYILDEVLKRIADKINANLSAQIAFYLE